MATRAKYHSEDFGNSIGESQKIDLIKFEDPIEGQNVDSNEKISIRFGRSVDLTDPYATKQFQADLIAAFKTTSSPLEFQAGTEIGDKISVSISGFDYSYNKMFADKDFNVQTAANAERLAEIMDEIIAKAIAVNAALDKFNYDTAVDSLGLNSTLFSTDHAFAVADDWHLI